MPAYQSPAPACNPSSPQADDVGELFQYASPRRSRCPGRNRPCCRSSTSRSKAAKSRSTTRRSRPSIRSCGLRLKNTTDLHLMQGPITVFDGGAYAGDARIEDIAARQPSG